jgi:hypothetical protein
VQGERAEVVGETGVVVVDLRRARFDVDGYAARGVRVSYLDDGDGFDLRRGRALPAKDKKRVRVGRASYRAPAPVRRNAFASYGFHDLLLRLVEADPSFYAQDSARAFDPAMAHQVTLHLRRGRAAPAPCAPSATARSATRPWPSTSTSTARLDVCPLADSTQVLQARPRTHRAPGAAGQLADAMVAGRRRGAA